jgi:hypothetical protein
MVDLLSLITLLQAAPAVSMPSSVSPEQNFSALLTELTGSLETPIPANGVASSLPETLPTEPQKAPAKTPPTHTPNTPPYPPYPENPGNAIIPGQRVVPDLHLPPGPYMEIPQPTLHEPAAAPRVQTATAAPVHTAEILADVKKIEIQVARERVAPPDIQVEPQPEQNAPVVTTDPIQNVRQPHVAVLPHAVAVQAVSLELEFSDRRQEDPAQTSPRTSDAPAPAHTPASTQYVDAARNGAVPLPLEQARPAQHIEIPNVPKLQVVRTVAMEIGEAESQVMVRIDERGGLMQLHFGAGGALVLQKLESSIGSLVRNLRQEKIEVSNVEVTAKPHIEKVRRMKEAK